MSSAAQTSADEPVYFWREGEAAYGFMSQWYYCPFRDDEDPNKIYETAEHYMMHQKALLFNDRDVAAQVLQPNQHPRTIKGLGRKVSGFSEREWNAKRSDIVRKGNLLKFTRAVTEVGFKRGTSETNKNLPPIQGSLKAMLLATGDREIVEASPYDAIWGVGMTAKDAEKYRRAAAAHDGGAGRKHDWKGLNLLGKALMEVREILREEEHQEAERDKDWEVV